MLAAGLPNAEAQPAVIPVSEERTGRWNGKIEARIAWSDGEPYLDGAACILTNGPIMIRLNRGRNRHDARSPEIWFRDSEIAGAEEITGPTIGKRAFQLDLRDWSLNPWFSNYDYDRETIIAGTGDPYLLFREGSAGPLLPGGLLVGPMLDSQNMRIHFRKTGDDANFGDKTIDGLLNVNISHLREALGWCVEGLANDKSISTLPRALSNRSH